MKIAAALLVLIVASEYLHASAGPPPFTNESPLITGTDGIYQAIASGVNLTGVFSFQLSSGIQTPSANLTINNWVFFIDGQIVQGVVSAAISQGRVVGVLDAGVGDLPVDSTGQLVLPTAFVIPDGAASGTFNGSIDYNSPLGAFEGSGVLVGLPAREDQLVTIGEETTTTTTDGTTISETTVVVEVTPLEIPESNFPETRFRFQGTRVSTAPIPAAAAPSPTPADTSG